MATATCIRRDVTFRDDAQKARTGNQPNAHAGIRETVMPAGIVTRALALYRESTRQHEGQALLESLTPRERQILAMMTHGADNRTVAERLQISYATVRTHVRSILAKLGARSQLEAVAKARGWGFRG